MGAIRVFHAHQKDTWSLDFVLSTGKRVAVGRVIVPTDGADQATAAGDAAKATEYTNAAEAFAAQLVTAEQGVEDLVAAARPPGQQVDPRRAVEVAPMAPREVTERGGVGCVEERGLERLH